MIVDALVIGLGKIGLTSDLKNNKIISHCKSLNKSKKFNLIGGVDKSLNSRKLFSFLYKKKSFSSIKSALKNLDPNLIIVATPTQTHLSIIKKIILFKNKNLKCVLVEKPVGKNFYETKKIFNILNKNNITGFVNFQRNSNPMFIKLSRDLKKERLLSCEVKYSGGMVNNGSHFLQLFRYFFGPIMNYILIEKKTVNKYDFRFTGFIFFKKANVYFLPDYNSKLVHSFKINNSIGVYEYKNIQNSITFTKFSGKYKKKRISTIDKSQSNVINEIEKFFLKKKYKLIKLKDFLETKSILTKIKNER